MTFTAIRQTGSVGELMIQDDGHDNAELYILGVNQEITQIPWTYTVNGVTQSWKSYNLPNDNAWHKLATVWVPYSQNITFSLGATGNSAIGGPTDFVQFIQRGRDETATTRVFSGTDPKYAVTYVNVAGTWRRAEPWVKVAGVWKRSV